MDRKALRAQTERILNEERIKWTQVNTGELRVAGETALEEGRTVQRFAEEASAAVKDGDSAPASFLTAVPPELLVDVATTTGKLLEEQGHPEAAYKCYARAAAADPMDGSPWYNMARVLINVNRLVSAQPRDPSTYSLVLGHLRKAVARGHHQAAAVEEVVRGFSALFADSGD
jgi:tetratricopeptide (TPR) repeat protein